MRGCLRFKRESDKWSGLAWIMVTGTVFFVVSTMLFGCSTPVKKEIREKICPIEKVCPKCPPAPVERFEGLYRASEGESDALENALRDAEERYMACEENWVRHQRKSR